MAKLFNITLFNSILQEYNQTVYAVSMTGKQIVLSNGVILTDLVSVKRCKKRVMSGHPIWKENFDKLYSPNAEVSRVAEIAARSCTSTAGGIGCQKKHSDKIRKNLNTGTPWNKGLKGKYPYSHKHTEASKDKISKANSGKNIGMYGKRMSAEERLLKSKLMKERILSGKFTPNSNNRNTH